MNTIAKQLISKSLSSNMSGHTGNLDITLKTLQSIVPKLSNELHKGQAGRVGVIGGSKEYTGAPYFAAISALRIGADIVHIFSTEPAAMVIKTYSPELIVHPLLLAIEDSDMKVGRNGQFEKAVESISDWFDRLHCLVIGPGLGRSRASMDQASLLIKQAKNRNMPIILDADALYLVSLQPDLISGYKNALLTPNKNEFDRLVDAVLEKTSEPSSNESEDDKLRRLCTKLGNVTILRKGTSDVICDGNHLVKCDADGSPRRCGGQGDILSGAAATFTHWASLKKSSAQSDCDDIVSPIMLGAFAASLFVRTCAKYAYSKVGRSMTTTEVIYEIHSAFLKLFPDG